MKQLANGRNGKAVKVARMRSTPVAGSRLRPPPKSAHSRRSPRPRQTLAEKLLRFAGIFKDLPADLAENHDHYIHGTPKK